MAPFLIGPPRPQPTPPQSLSSTTSTGNPFIDQMVSTFNTTTTTTSSPPPMGFTENFSPTFLSTGNPCLDFFFHIVPDTPSDSLTQRLNLAWSYNPLTTLKLICNLRGVRGTGKSDKNGFYTAALWLHQNHPKTLACNLPCFADFGYFKDFPEILFRVLGLNHVPKIRKKVKEYDPFKTKKKFKKSSKCKINKKPLSGKEDRIRNSALMQEREKQVAGEVRVHKKTEMANKALERYKRDPDYRFLHDRVSDLFADHLRSDLEYLQSGNLNKISLAAKWCPSLDSCFDRATLLWKGKVITFSENPQLHLIEGDDLKSKTEFVRRMDWGMNTDFQKVFDLILNVAVQGKLSGDQMIKRVFVFSDMEFDQARSNYSSFFPRVASSTRQLVYPDEQYSPNPWETDYMVIKRKYEENGYGEVVPEIVFWNLRDSTSTPVAKNQNGVALVSGFSKNMMKLFLDGKEVQLNPETVMEAAISGEEYKKLVVLD